MGETRLMAMQFIPSNQGGYWWPAGVPAAVPITAEDEQAGWVDAWENGITAEEAKVLADGWPTEAMRAKLRALSTEGCK